MLELSDKPAERVEQAKIMKKELDESIAAVKDILDQLDTTKRDMETLTKVSDLANREYQLANQAADMAKQPQATNALRNWHNEQKNLNRELSETLKNDPQAKAAQLKADEKLAAALASASVEMAKQQDEMKRLTDKLGDPSAKEALKQAMTKDVQNEQQQLAKEADQLGKEMKAAGRIRKMPALIAVQSKGSDPLVRAFKSKGKVKYVEPRTKADAIAVGFPTFGDQALEALRETRGTAVSVSDAEMEKEQKALYRAEFKRAQQMLLRVTTRVCHTQAPVLPRPAALPAPNPAGRSPTYGPSPLLGRTIHLYCPIAGWKRRGHLGKMADGVARPTGSRRSPWKSSKK